MTGIIDARNERGRDDRTDAGEFGQAAAIFPFSANLDDLRIEFSDAYVDVPRSDISACSIAVGLGGKAPWSLWQYDAILGQKAAGVIDERSALDD
ncbi:hypothetical protein ABID19_006946 [Mesorhizobium robiniae]|uniref:Uncharacterized protein n=1 Tax=Mesorhizobium robiniae TaxID=559315 RepID=A0ABV2H021_9HYPH